MVTKSRNRFQPETTVVVKWWCHFPSPDASNLCRLDGLDTGLAVATERCVPGAVRVADGGKSLEAWMAMVFEN